LRLTPERNFLVYLQTHPPLRKSALSPSGA